MKIPFVTNIQRYSIHDGTGTRTTVFFKGCPLRCQWCHNPETQDYQPSIQIFQDRCVECENCILLCKQGAARKSKTGKMYIDKKRCTLCGACINACHYDCRKWCGKQYPLEELLRILKREVPFYETSNGGVTLSGGEVLTQNLDYVTDLMEALYECGISVNIDTCGAVPFKVFEQILPYTDTFLYDIKLIDQDKHKKYTGKSNDCILDNVRKLSELSAKIWVRIPVIGGVNDSEKDIHSMIEFLKTLHYEQVNLLPYHSMGIEKYRQEGMIYQGELFYTPSQTVMEELKKTMVREGIHNVVIGG